MIFIIILMINIFLLFCIYLIRYRDLKEIIFILLAKKYNIKNIVYYKEINIPEIIKILSLNTKGKFIEYNIAIPAWYPIISLESTDNEEWETVKKNFLYFITETKLNSSLLVNIITSKVEQLVNDNICIDSIQISKIIVSSFCKLIFDVELDNEQLELFYKGSIEWRKELSMKELGNISIKYKCIDEIIKIIKSNNNIYMIFKEDWAKPEYYSVIMQPFIISPMINLSDIMVNYSELLDNKKITNDMPITNDLVNLIIYSFHPFPILERYDPTTDTQYFIPLDKLTNFNNYSNQNKILVFGTGSRKCAGINFAYDIVKTLVTLYNKYPKTFKPKINHLYSGRINDKFVFNELLYTIKTIFNIFVRKNKIN
jgi:hypothetical protein